jgi:TRAP-type mannitol/chloroaromatic compound transport system substrate-binding protein
MERRRFIRHAALGAAGATAVTALASCGGDGAGTAANGAPAVQTGRRVRWRLASSFPRSSDIIYRASETLSERVAALTDGQFEIRAYPAGEIVPGLQVLDAVQNRTVAIGHTAGYYYVGKNPALAFETGVPFGMTARQHNAWLLYGGGLDLTRGLLADFGVVNLPGGNTGTQMGGWWRRPVNSLAELRGLKMRIPGLGAQVMDRLGVTALTLPGGEIYQALERGNLDATEWIGPYDDEKLGFYKVATNYLYPGWWEPSAMLAFYINQSEWDRLPSAYQQALEVAADEVNIRMLAEYDAKNPPALDRLLAEGVRLQAFPDDVMTAAYDAAQSLYAETAAGGGGYGEVYDAYRQFQQSADRWFGVAQQAYADFAFSHGNQRIG